MRAKLGVEELTFSTPNFTSIVAKRVAPPPEWFKYCCASTLHWLAVIIYWLSLICIHVSCDKQHSLISFFKNFGWVLRVPSRWTTAGMHQWASEWVVNENTNSWTNQWMTNSRRRMSTFSWTSVCSIVREWRIKHWTRRRTRRRKNNVVSFETISRGCNRQRIKN